MSTSAVAILGAIAGFVSAIFWFAAALIPTPAPAAYLSGPPQWAVRRLKAQSICNAIAAASSGIAAASAAYVLYNTPSGPN